MSRQPDKSTDRILSRREFALLEKAFVAEIDGAMGDGIGLMQTKSKLAQKLELGGYILKKKRILQGRGRGLLVIEGYTLTEKGRFTYCMSC